MDEPKVKELIEALDKKTIICGVLMSDKASLCGKPAIDLILVGDVKPPAFLPTCEEHTGRFTKGSSFLVRELDGERNFAISMGELNSEDDTDTLTESPLGSEPPADVTSPSSVNGI